MYLLNLGRTFVIFCEMHASLSALYPHYVYEDSQLWHKMLYFRNKITFTNKKLIHETS